MSAIQSQIAFELSRTEHFLVDIGTCQQRQVAAGAGEIQQPPDQTICIHSTSPLPIMALLVVVVGEVVVPHQLLLLLLPLLATPIHSLPLQLRLLTQPEQTLARKHNETHTLESLGATMLGTPAE